MRRLAQTLVLTAIAGTSAATLQAQSVVQLPTFRQFGASTTVSVPDRGSMLIGGVRGAREGSVTRGLPFASKLPGLSRLGKNRGIGRETNAATLSMHATIIDLREMDEALLGEAARLASGAADENAHAALAAKLTRHIDRSPPPKTAVAAASSPAPIVEEPADARPTVAAARATPPSVAALKQRAAAAREAEYEEARQWFVRGAAAEKAGKAGVAKIYYRMAGRRGDKAMRIAVTQRLRNLEDQRRQ